MHQKNLVSAAGPAGALRSIPEITADIRANFRNAAISIAAIGQDLTEAKRQLEHGEWLPWLKSLGISSSTAENYMRYAAEVQQGSILASMPYTKAIAMLSVPEEQRKAFVQTNDVESKSAAEVKRLVADLKKAQARAEAAERELREAEEKPPREKIVEKRVEVCPEDYGSLKTEVQNLRKRAEEAEEAAILAEEKAAAAVSESQKIQMQQLEDDQDPDEDQLSVSGFTAACLDFTGRTWQYQFADATYREMEDWEINGFRMFAESVRARAQGILDALDRSREPLMADEVVISGE